jgi:hypothetical protein
METSDIIDATHLNSRRAWWFLQFGPVVLLSLAAMSFVLGLDASYWLPLAVIGVFGVVYILFGVRRSVDRTARSMIGEEVVFVVDGTGTHQDVAGSHWWVEWWALTGVLESDTSILLRRDRLTSSFIPKRAFRDEADLDEFLDFVHGHLGAEAAPA